jgi:hypothetical protein
MAKGELFDISDIQECRKPLGPQEKDAAVRKIIRNARMGIKYFYSIREACGILHCTYDELMTILAAYRLDAVLFRSVYRIPWWELAAYIFDEEDDLEGALDEYLQKIARRASC